MHCSTSFYKRDLSIHGFWSLQGVLEPIPLVYQGPTVVKFGGSEKLYVDVLLHGGSAPLTLLFNSQLYSDVSFSYQF